MEQFVGVKYKLKTSENFEEYLKCINVGLFMRKLAQANSPVCTLTRDGDVYILTISAPIRTITTAFKIDEEFDEDRPDGVKVKSTVTIEDNKLIQVQIEPGGKKSVHVREFTPEKLTVKEDELDALLMTSTVDGWDSKCVRVYERLK